MQVLDAFVGETTSTNLLLDSWQTASGWCRKVWVGRCFLVDGVIERLSEDRLWRLGLSPVFTFAVVW